MRDRRPIPLRFAWMFMLFLSTPLAASAQDADALIEQGIRLRERRRDEDALRRFEAAYAIDQSPRALAQIALAEQALSRWLVAHRHLMEALASDDPWITERSAILSQALTAIEAHVGRLSVTGAPAGAEVTIDDAVVGTLPLETVIEPGTHVIEVTAEGYSPHRVEVSVTPGWRAEEAVDLEALETETTPVDLSPSSPGVSMHPAGPIVLGIGGALLVAGVITGVLVLDLDGQISSMCPDPTRCPATVRPIASDRSTLAALTDVFLFTGGAAAVAGLIMTLLLTEGAAPAEVALRPHLDASGAALVVEGAF